ncbi:MAG: hypothetical protein R2715_12060 [Ilumatobacteraceae bacterium]
MAATAQAASPSSPKNFAIDAVITAAIVWVFVLLGEPLSHVLTDPIFIVLTLGGLARLVHKTFRPRGPAST